MIIYRGDQYAVPFTIKVGNQVVTPEEVDDVRIQIGNDLREMSEETLTYNPDRGTWDFFLTEKLTRGFSKGPVYYQVGIKMGDEIRYSSTKQLRIDDNIIGAVWGNA